ELPIVEALLTPFYVNGAAVGTVWVIAHDVSRQFDREDLRLLMSLGKVASAAYTTLQSLRVTSDSRDRLHRELTGAHRLQRASTELIREDDREFVYAELLHAAIAVAQSDMATLQLLHEEHGDLVMTASEGLAPASVAQWARVRAGAPSTYGTSLSTGARAEIEDVEASAALAGTPDLEAFRYSGIRGAQSTPLVSRSGRVLGMLSTQWRQPHALSARDVQLIDVLARQGADAIERLQADDALRQSTSQFEALFDSAPAGMFLVDHDFRIRAVNRAARPAFGAASDVIGRNFEEVIHLLLPQAEAADMTARFRHTFETGKPDTARKDPALPGETHRFPDWQIHRAQLRGGHLGVVCHLGAD
nr:GAF domain-containing protein [Acidobacteriota bacterium]